MFEDIIKAVKSDSEASQKTLSEDITPVAEENSGIRISVIGVGGAGCNCIHRIVSNGLKSANAIAINTDGKQLNVIKADKKILIGKTITRGLGAGGDPQMGKKCAEADAANLKNEIGESEIVFLTGGMGGGTGTGALPVVARIAKDLGAIVIAFVTYPFKLERSKTKVAQKGIQDLIEVADTVVVIDNNRLLDYAPNLPLTKAFELADSITSRAVTGIADTIMFPSLMNIDYADVKAIMKNGGIAFISIGEGTGHDKVSDAIKAGLEHPLLDVDTESAKGALIHLEGGADLTLGDAVKIGDGVTAALDSEANVKVGARINPELPNSVRVTSIFVGVKSPMMFKREAESGIMHLTDNDLTRL
ncbi:cell division protein FtsZ [Candidatus Micrarchaeota archaeon]|nr:cell division protein FtsZ [Candidatus Micrarchaeota archaeon]